MADGKSIGLRRLLPRGGCERPALVLAWVCVFLFGLAAAGGDTQASKRKQIIKEWAQEVVPGEDKQPIDVACRTLETRMQKQITAMKSLKAKIASAGSGPPPTVLALLESLSGKQSETGAAKSARLRLERERKSADQLNDLLRISNCPTVDIEKALEASGKVETEVSPEAGGSLKQRQMDDLVRSPR